MVVVAWLGPSWLLDELNEVEYLIWKGARMMLLSHTTKTVYISCYLLIIF